MQPVFSLSYLTCLDQPPPSAIAVAAAAGYSLVGLRLLPAGPGGIAHRLMDDPAGLANTLAALRDTGVSVFDLEMIRLGADFSVEPYRAFLETGARLGARAVLVAGDDSDEGRLIDSFGALCEASAPYGLSAELEFMPQTQVRDVRSALRVLTGAGQANAGIIVDALHFQRSRSSIDDALAIPAHWLTYLQICDAPAEIPATIAALNYTARHERLLPGEGGIDLVGLFAKLPRDLPISVEVPNDQRAAAAGAIGWARQALAAARAVLAAAWADAEVASNPAPSRAKRLP